MSEFVKDIDEVIARYPAVIQPWLRKAMKGLREIEEPPNGIAAEDVEGVTVAVGSIAVSTGILSNILFDYLEALTGKGETVQ